MVHLTGLPCDLNKIRSIVKNKKISIIEDCAHSLGTKYRSRHVGNLGLSGCFSFIQLNKLQQVKEVQ